MAFKFVLLSALLAIASAGLIPAGQLYHVAPAGVVKTISPVATKSVEEYDAHPQYKYAYDVQDAISGDSKSQSEERDGDVVHGHYSVADADGYKRTVHYTVDGSHGFQAEVQREPIKHLFKDGDNYSSPKVVKTLSPAAHFSTAPVKHFLPGPEKLFTSYSAPASYVTQH